MNVASLLSVWSAPAKKPDSMPSMKFATLKFRIALALNKVSGGSPLGTPPPACSAVAGDSRTGACAPGDAPAGGAAGCDEAGASMVEVVGTSREWTEEQR